MSREPVTYICKHCKRTFTFNLQEEDRHSAICICCKRPTEVGGYLCICGKTARLLRGDAHLLDARHSAICYASNLKRLPKVTPPAPTDPREALLGIYDRLEARVYSSALPDTLRNAFTYYVDTCVRLCGKLLPRWRMGYD